MLKYSINIISVVLLSVIAIVARSQAVQPGVVLQYNQEQEKTPLAGVLIEVKGAGTYTSAADGTFTLSFLTKKPGDLVESVKITKAGYELFNERDVNQWVISRNRNPFTIVLVKSNSLSQQKQTIKENVSYIYKVKYEKSLQEIERLKKKNEVKEEEYIRQLANIKQQLNEAMSNVDTYVDLFVHIDLSEISEEERHILKMIQDGQIEEAYNAYKDLLLVDKLKKEVTSYRTINNSLQQMKSDINGLYDAVQRKVSTYIILEKDEDAEEEIESLLEAINPLYELFPNEYRPHIAEIHYQLGDFALNDFLGDCYDRAQEHFLIAEELYSSLTKDNPEQYLSYLAKTQEGMGEALKETDSIDCAEHYYIKALNNWTLIADMNSNNPENIAHLANIQHKLGNLYLDMYQDEVLGILFNEEKDTTSNNVKRILDIKTKAESFFSDAFENYNKIISYNPGKYSIALAETQRDLGNFYASYSEPVKAEKLFTSMVQNIERALAENDTVDYVEALADAQSLMAHNSGQNENREDDLLTSLENCFRHLTLSPDKIAWTFQCVFDDLCVFYYQHFPEKEECFLRSTLDRINHLCNDSVHDRILLLRTHVEDKYFNYFKLSNNYKQIEKICADNLNLYIPLFLKNPEQYQDRISYYYRMLRDVYGNKKEFIERHTQTYLDELELWKKVYEQNPDKYRKYLCDLYLFIGEHLRHLKEADKAKEYYNKGLDLLDDSMLAVADMSLLGEKAVLQIELGMNSNMLYEREKYYLSALKCYTSLYKQDSNRYVNDWLLMHERLGQMYFNQSIFDKAEEHFKVAYENRLKHFNSMPFSTDRVWDTLHDLDIMYRSQRKFDKLVKLWSDFTNNCDSLCREMKKGGGKDMYNVLEKAYKNLGTLYSDMNDYPNAIKAYSTILEKAELLYKKDSDGYLDNVAKFHGILGSVYLQNKDYSSSIQHYLNAEELYGIYPDYYSEKIADMQEGLGTAYWQLYKTKKSSSEKAEACLLDASARYYALWQRDFGQLNDSPYKEKYMNIQLLLGDFYYDQNNTDKAKKHYYRVLDYREKIGNSKDLIEKMKERGLLDSSHIN